MIRPATDGIVTSVENIETPRNRSKGENPSQPMGMFTAQERAQDDIAVSAIFNPSGPLPTSRPLLHEGPEFILEMAIAFSGERWITQLPATPLAFQLLITHGLYPRPDPRSSS